MRKKAGGKSPLRYKPLRVDTLAIILRKMDSNMDMEKMILPQYIDATLSVEHTGMWRICWYNRNPDSGELERIRKTCGLNRIKDVAKRKEVANGYIKSINAALKGGYNHFLTVEENAKVLGITDLPQIKAALQQETTVLAALEKATKLRIMGKAQRTVTSYSSNHRIFMQWLTDQELHLLPVSEFTEDIFTEYLFYKSEQGHGNSNINDHISYFKTCFEIIRKNLKLIEKNPLENINLLTKQASSLFQPLTDDEIARIVPVLIAYNPRFYLFTRFIPHEYIRPWHIARLKASDIDYKKEYIFLSAETTKNKKKKHKQLLQTVKAMLQQMGYDKLPGHYYLFGKNFEPSPTLHYRLSIVAAEIWKELVIDGLCINKKMYALKHTSSQYFVNENENADIKYLQGMMEHGSMRQTEIYLQDKIIKRIDQAKTKTLDY